MGHTNDKHDTNQQTSQPEQVSAPVSSVEPPLPHDAHRREAAPDGALGDAGVCPSSHPASPHVPPGPLVPPVPDHPREMLGFVPGAPLPGDPNNTGHNWSNEDGTKRGGSQLRPNDHLEVNNLPLMDPARMNNGRFKAAAKAHRMAAMLDDEASQAWKRLMRDRRARKEELLQSEEELEQLMRDYTTFLAENPFIHEKPTSGGGTFREKVRSVPTIEGIAAYSGVTPYFWKKWLEGRGPEPLRDALEVVRAQIFDTALVMAAGGEANAPLIKSYLGIADRHETNTHLSVSDAEDAKASLLEVLGVTQEELDTQVASIDSARDAVGGAQEVTGRVVLEQPEDDAADDAGADAPEHDGPEDTHAAGPQGGGAPHGVANDSASGGLVTSDKIHVNKAKEDTNPEGNSP